jgi:diguanylate cyclase (GGDEF)-like protein
MQWRSRPGWRGADRPAAADAARVSSLRAVASRRLLIRGLFATPLAAPLIAFMMHRAATTEGVLAWLVIAYVGFTIALTSAIVLSRRRPDSPNVLAVPAGIIGLTWGLAGPVLDPTTPATQAVLALVFVTVISVAVVMNAVTRAAFLCMALAIVFPATWWLSGSSDDTIRMLAPLAFILVGLFGVLHAEVKAMISSALTSQARNERLVEELEGERERIVVANDALTVANEQLHVRAHHDALTGLLNRHGLIDEIERLISSAQRAAEVAVIYLDLDRFKLVNDALGHMAGDRLLRTVAERCLGAVPAGARIARLGGDEFCIVAYPVADAVEAMDLAEGVRAALDRPIAIDGRAIMATTSVGVAVSSKRREGAEDLLRFADAALYVSKDAGRNRVALFDDSMRSSMERRIDEASELRRALDAGLIVPWYQPEVDLATGRIIGAEALARWMHPTKGVLAAGRFMPLAEEVGLDRPISASIGAAVLRARVAWREVGIDHAFRLRFNVTAQQLDDGNDIASLIGGAVDDRIAAEGLSIEVTETGIIRDIDRAVGVLQRVRDAGVTVALDDFGTGHSSMSLLQRLPLDGLKIDRSFVRDLADDPRDRALVRAAITMATELHMKVTAEGVETEEQADILRSYGCHTAQGFLYSPAVSEVEILDMLRTEVRFH